MSCTPKLSSKPRQSLFYRDLASPISTTRSASRFAAATPLFRSSENTPPPPPIFTLEDRVDFSPEPPPPASPETYPDPKTPTPVRNYHSTPERSRSGVGNSEEKGKGLSSPVNGVVVNSGTPKMKELIMLPPPREAVRLEMKDKNINPMVLSGMVDEEEWVTVYGFSPGDTNLVLREFEKCGVILKHITGPRDANWMHILYQNRYDAQKALGKNGMQLNSVLIIGVKPIDPMQRQYLNERLNSSTSNGGGFMVLLPSRSTQARSTGTEPVVASSRPHYSQNGSSKLNDRYHSTGAVASPAKSYVSRVMDMMFSF